MQRIRDRLLVIVGYTSLLFTFYIYTTAKAIEEKRRCYKIWHKTKTANDRNNYKEARRNARSVALAQEKTRQELVNELESTAGRKNVYRVAKQMAKSRQDIVGVNCVKDANGKNW